jgi:hypothetical protein
MSQNLSIAYLNQYLLEHPVLLPTLTDIDHRLPGLVYGRNEFVGGGYFSAWYNRIGKDTMFCKNPGLIEFNKPVINYSQSDKLTFEQVSDKRCLDLRASHWHKPWVIMWSGGIDSTVILVSIIRNLPPSDFGNIQVWCTNTSIYENPKFFNDHIRPNFEIISDHDTLNVYKDVFLIAGECEYMLGFGASFFARSAEEPGVNELRWADNRDFLIKSFSSTSWPSTSEIDFFNWVYNAMGESIRSTGLPIITIREWWWWMLFNYQWTAVIMHHIDHHCAKENNTRFLKNYIPWFHSNDYQIWGIQNLNEIARIKNKSIGKQYIHTVLKDEYYLNFKSKIDSSSRVSHRKWFTEGNTEPRPKLWANDYVYDDRLFCVLNNNECLYLDRDQDQIIELLPEHINLDSLNYL